MTAESFAPKSDFIRVLQERGYIHQASDLPGIDADEAEIADRRIALAQDEVEEATADLKVARALVGAFGVNQRAFNAASGAGYRFLADQLIALDRLNPQTAAKLLPPLGRWRRFDAERAGLMRAELERIVATPGLSKDLFEQASKSLEG